jgi:hypothetical protein
LPVTDTDAVSLHPDALVHMNLYVPADVNPVMLVAALLAFAMLAVPGLPVIAVHAPVPVADMAALPPGSTAQLTIISAPASGFAVTITDAVSPQPDTFDQMNLYVPAALKPVMLVVGRAVFVILAVPGLPVIAVHVPVLVAVIFTAPPGNVAQLTVLSEPAFGFAVTTTDAVSLQPDALVHMNL